MIHVTKKPVTNQFENYDFIQGLLVYLFIIVSSLPSGQLCQSFCNISRNKKGFNKLFGMDFDLKTWTIILCFFVPVVEILYWLRFAEGRGQTWK